MNEEVIKRKTIKLHLKDNKEYTIKPLALDRLIEVWPIIEELRKLSKQEVTVESLGKMKEITHVALKDSGYDVPKEQIGKLVDLDDITEIIGIIVGQKRQR